MSTTAHTRKRWAGQAVGSLVTALLQGSTLDAPTAQRFARTLLSNPHVKIGPGGALTFRGKSYTADQFAKSPFAALVTGTHAAELNKRAIEGEAGYLSDISRARFQQQLDTAGLEDQRRRAVLDYGDPLFAGQDPTLAAEASRNPFSIRAALARASDIQQQQARQAANRAGTFQGGGLQSGLGEVQRQTAVQGSDALRQVQDLLSQIGQRTAQAGSAFALTQNEAYQNAAQRLSANGALHAATPPPVNWTVGQYHYAARPPVRQGPGSRPPSHFPPPPPAPPPHFSGAPRPPRPPWARVR